MSANNYLIIDFIDGYYVVIEKDAETQNILSEHHQADTLEEAIEEANKVMVESDIEYGIQYIQVKKEAIQNA